jgi:hypothetical protein
MDASTDLGTEYSYQVTLDDGRTFPVTSEFNFDFSIPTDLYRSKPNVRLVLVDFRGKPAVEVRIMEPGYQDTRLTYIRENPIKAKAPVQFPVDETSVENPANQEMTLSEMNKNISQPILLSAMEKGYDALYKNVPYNITNVTDKTVSLRSIGGVTVTVNISEVSELRDGKGLVKDQVDIETAKINQAVANSILTSLDDSLSLDAALKSIKTNKC